ncbi:NDR1/HIN1-like protein 1, partial [Linum perenne]
MGKSKHSSRRYNLHEYIPTSSSSSSSSSSSPSSVSTCDHDITSSRSKSKSSCGRSNIINIPNAAVAPPPPLASPPHPRPSRKCCIIKIAAAAVILVGLTVLIAWAILRPTKPTFYVQDTTVQALNLTDSRLLTTSLHVTISSRNPNSHLGIDYVSIGIYASYRGQKITLPVELPEGYLGNKEVVEWSPILSGKQVPLSPDMAMVMAQDLKAGLVPVDLMLYGRLTWKNGLMFTRNFNLDVDCPAYLNGNSSAGAGGNGGGLGGMA